MRRRQLISGTMKIRPARAGLITALLLLGGCAGRWEAATRDDLDVAARRLRFSAQAASAAQPAPKLDGSLAGYLGYAMRHSPPVRAAFERWRAAVLHISRARRLPEPVASYGYFISSVETRVGPQRQRLSLSQAFPWPTKLTAGADAASARARAAERRFDAEELALREQVAVAYFRLWRLRRTRAIDRAQQVLLRGLVASARGRVETGKASLADMTQVQLSLARLGDVIGRLGAQERAARAALAAVVGAPANAAVPTTEPPPSPGLPGEKLADLRRAASENPRIAALARVADASDAEARRAGAQRYPSFALGATWIDTGPAAAPNVPDSGKDALIAMASIKLPLWQKSYGDDVAAARARAQAARADAAAARLSAERELESALAAVRDADRRIALYEQTLLPEANTVYTSVLGGYQTGRSTVAATLLAERDLLELEIGLARARADYGTEWARLERIVGRPVPRKEVSR